MPHRQEELQARADHCKKEALRAMEAAEKAPTDEIRSEYLRLAVEWLKLSSDTYNILVFTRQSFAGESISSP